jgi:hypothetical protein
VFRLLPLGLGYARNVNLRCLYTMAFTVCNEPVRLVILAADLQRDLMGNVPFLPDLYLSAAEMTDAVVAQEDCRPRLSG